ncbi:hypothetical protein [Dryocola clanedunensis]
MKLPVIALVVVSFSAPVANAAYNPSEAAAATQQINQGLSQISNAQAPNQIKDGQNNIDAGISRIENMTGGTYVGSVPAGTGPQPERDTAADAHTTYAAETARAYNAALTAAKYAGANQIANMGVKNDPTGSPVAQGNTINGTSYREGITQQQQKAMGVAPGTSVSTPDQTNTITTNQPTDSAVAQSITVNATAYREGITQQQQKAIGVAPGTLVSSSKAPASINVAAAALHPDTPVSVSINGVTQATTAGALAAVNPDIQISVPHVAVFESAAVKGGFDHNSDTSSSVGHQGRGQENAHSHAFGGHGYGADNSHTEGFGGHSHFH